MNRSRRRPLVRGLILGLVSVGTLLSVAAIVFVWFVRRPFPDYRAMVDVPGVSAPVEVFRDEYGVPHIFATTSQDAAFAQGYVHAQDRFWQMEFWRRIGAGRLAEILGEGLVETDRYLRTMGFRRVAEREFEAMPEPYRGWLEAYAAGVNAYVTTRRPARLGLEFAVLALTDVRFEIDPWSPVDTLTWAKIMAQDLSGNLGTELTNLRNLAAGGRPLVRLLAPPYRDDMPVIVRPDEVSVAPGGGDAVAPVPVGVARTGHSGIGSNNWVIAGSRTDSGAPILANDMHLAVQLPSIWYEIGVHVVPAAGTAAAGSEALSLRGYSFPGVPGVIAGQNGEIAWGVTNLGGDVQDLYRETLDPEEPDRYRDGATWRSMTTRTEEIYVAGEEEPIRHRVRETVRGPVITDLAAYATFADVHADSEAPSDAPDLDSVAPTALSLRWTALQPSTIVRAIYDLNRAIDYTSFKAALELWDVPGQNVVFADRFGTIAYQATGRHPVRDGQEGQFPADGSGEAGWRDAVPYRAMPAVRDPEKGYIVTANNPVTDESYPWFLGMNFANGYRAARITELIERAGTAITPATVESMHADVLSIPAREMTPYLVALDADTLWEAWQRARSAWVHPAALERDPDDDERAREIIGDAHTALAAWDYRLTRESSGAAIYGFVWMEIIERVLADEGATWAWPSLSVTTSESVIYAIIDDPDHSAWDDRTTATVERRDDVLAVAFAAGVLAAREELGDDVTDWEWGAVHRVEFRNATLGESGIGPVERIFNRGPFPAPGGPSTVNVAHWSVAEPFALTSIASQRAIYDLSDPSASRFIHPTGQSGHPFHRHYDDFMAPWNEVQYHPANWTREEIEASAGRRRLVLRPLATTQS